MGNGVMSSLGINIGNPETDCPPPNELWSRESAIERKQKLVRLFCNIGYPDIRVESAPDSGYIEVSIPDDMGAAERGAVLLMLEESVQAFYGGVYLLVKPTEDKNRLRRLRGVTVKENDVTA